MSGFYKAELPEDPAGWTESVIVEGVGTPDEHSDRFWRKGPYGIEQNSDGTFEAYVIVGGTPFKIGGGFGDFSESVMFITSSMVSKDLPEGADHPDAPKPEGPEPEAPVDKDGESEPAPPAPKDGEAEDATEATEKSDTGEERLGPVSQDVNKSESFEKIQHPVQYDEATDTYPVTEDELAEIGDAAGLSYDRESGMLPPDTDTGVLDTNPEGAALGRRAYEDALYDGEARRLPSADYRMAGMAERAVAKSASHAMLDSIFSLDPKERDVTDAQLRFRRSEGAMVAGDAGAVNPIYGEDPEEGFARSTAGQAGPVGNVEDAMQKSAEDQLNDVDGVFGKSGDLGGDGCSHVEGYDPGHPGEVYERHYIDDHALGKARIMVDAPSLEAFERSVGGFRELMASKNARPSSLYHDQGSDFRDGFAKSEAFAKKGGGGVNPNWVSPRERRQRIEMGLDPGGDSSADFVIPDTGYLTRRSPTLGANAQGTDTKTYVDRNTGKHYNGRSRFTDRMGHYRDEYGGPEGNRHHGENHAGSLADAVQGRGKGVPTEDNPRVERFNDPYAAEARADQLRGGVWVGGQKGNSVEHVQFVEPVGKYTQHGGRGPNDPAPLPVPSRTTQVADLNARGGGTLQDYMDAIKPKEKDIIDPEIIEAVVNPPNDPTRAPNVPSATVNLIRKRQEMAAKQDIPEDSEYYRLFMVYGQSNYDKALGSMPIPADTQDEVLKREKAKRKKAAAKWELSPEAAEFFVDNGTRAFMDEYGYAPNNNKAVIANMGNEDGSGDKVTTSRHVNADGTDIDIRTEEAANGRARDDAARVQNPPEPVFQLKWLSNQSQKRLSDIMADAGRMYRDHLNRHPDDEEGADKAASQYVAKNAQKLDIGAPPDKETSVYAYILDHYRREVQPRYHPKVQEMRKEREESASRKLGHQYGTPPRPADISEQDAEAFANPEERFSPEEYQDARNRAELRNMANALEEGGKEEQRTAENPAGDAADKANAIPSKPRGGTSYPKRTMGDLQANVANAQLKVQTLNDRRNNGEAIDPAIYEKAMDDLRRASADLDTHQKEWQAEQAKTPEGQRSARRKELEDEADRTYARFMELKAEFDPLHEMRLANEKQLKNGRPPIEGYNPKRYNELLDMIKGAQKDAQAAKAALREFMEDAPKPTPPKPAENNTGGDMMISAEKAGLKVGEGNVDTAEINRQQAERNLARSKESLDRSIREKNAQWPGSKRQKTYEPPKPPEDAPKAEQKAPKEPRQEPPKEPKDDTPKEPKQEPPKESKQESGNTDDGKGDEIRKSDDPSRVSFRDMLAFEKSKRDSQRGVPVSMDPIGYDGMRDGRPIKELYRNVTIGEGKDCSSSAYDPKVHRTDSESRRLRGGVRLLQTSSF